MLLKGNKGKEFRCPSGALKLDLLRPRMEISVSKFMHGSRWRPALGVQARAECNREKD